MKYTVIASLLLSASVSVLAQAPAKEAMCAACHGPAGAKPISPSYPKLNGQNKQYLIDSMKAYKAGKRTGGLAAVMTAQSQALTDADIEALAEYYSSQK